MKPNPRPDWCLAPVYLPEKTECQMKPELYIKQQNWMASVFWDLVEEVEAMRKRIDQAYEDGFELGEREGNKDSKPKRYHNEYSDAGSL